MTCSQVSVNVKCTAELCTPTYLGDSADNYCLWFSGCRTKIAVLKRWRTERDGYYTTNVDSLALTDSGSAGQMLNMAAVSV